MSELFQLRSSLCCILSFIVELDNLRRDTFLEYPPLKDQLCLHLPSPIDKAGGELGHRIASRCCVSRVRGALSPPHHPHHSFEVWWGICVLCRLSVRRTLEWSHDKERAVIEISPHRHCFPTQHNDHVYLHTDEHTLSAAIDASSTLQSREAYNTSPMQGYSTFPSPGPAKRTQRKFHTGIHRLHRY